MDTEMITPNGVLAIGRYRPTILIGNRINTSNHISLRLSLVNKDYSLLINEALKQVSEGARILYVRISCNEIEEEQILPKVVQLLSETVPVPLCISTQNPYALEKTLEIYPGKIMFDHVSADKDNLKTFLPLLIKAGAVVIGRAEENGNLPERAADRIEVARQLLRSCISAGVPREDIIIDPVVTPFQNQDDALLLLEIISTVSSIEDINIVIRSADIGNGLDNNNLEVLFSTLAVHSGATCLVADPLQICTSLKLINVLLNRVE
jgi:5-methyltetrahydrofolate--homocysteine methyltransferase